MAETGIVRGGPPPPWIAAMPLAHCTTVSKPRRCAHHVYSSAACRSAASSAAMRFSNPSPSRFENGRLLGSAQTLSAWRAEAERRRGCRAAFSEVQPANAINATAAVDMAISMKPDVIFLDLLLPDGHGADVCVKLRSHPLLREIRIFAVTASNRMLDHQLALDAGCDDVLRKPVLPDTFERLINGGLSRRKLREFLFTKRDDTPK